MAIGMDEEYENDMPDEEERINPQEFIASVLALENIVSELPEGDAHKIATQVLADYKLDKQSMSDWEQQMEAGIELAKLVKSEKTYPFKKAANVKYPLVTSAALQFNARAYPAIVASDGLVKVETYGEDPNGAKAARGERVAAHMSWQLTNQMDEWEEDTDNLLLQLPIVGSMFRKVWYDPIDSRPRSRLLPPGAFIVNKKVTSLANAPRATEELPLYPSEIMERIKASEFVEFEYGKDGEDKDAPHDFIEQHMRWDLDGDGYPEPYIVVVHRDTQTLVKMVADFTEDDVRYETEVVEVAEQVAVVDQMGQPMIDAFGQPMVQMQMAQQEVATGIQRINRNSYFVAYKFMPSIDGGFYGTGLGLLLGDISHTINTIINMMLDAGHMSSLGGGFIGSEFKIRGASSRFEPGEWKLAKATGGEIRNSIVPMTFPGPDGTLFQLLGMLIEAGKEISSTKDIMTGDTGGRTQTATTTIALIEQGMMVFTAAYKRIFRALRQEYKLLARINATTVDPEQYNAFHDMVDENGQPVMFDPAQDYGYADMDICPTADPRSVTKMQEMAKAQMLMQMADAQLVNRQEAANRMLEAANIGNREALAIPQDPMAMQMAQFQAQMAMQMAQADLTQKMVDIDMTIAEIEAKKASALKDMADIDAQQERIRLDALTALLKERRDDIDQLIRGGLAGMAGPSGNGANARSVGGAVSQATTGGAGSLLGGQAMAGGTAGSPGPANLMA